MSTDLQTAKRSLHHALTHPAVRAGLCALAVALAALSAAAVWARVAAGELSDARVQLDAKHRSAASAARAQALYNAYHETQQRLAAHDRRRPPSPASLDKPTQAQLVQAISQLAERSDLTLLNETYDPLREHGESGWRVSLAGQASYPAVRAFVGGLPTLAMPVHAERIRIDATRDGGAVLKVQMLLRAAVAGAPQPTQERARAATPANAAQSAQAFEAADFDWPIDAVAAPGSAAVARDPFQRAQPQSDLTNAPVAKVVVAATAAAPSDVANVPPDEPPVPSEIERAQAELDAMRLTGMVVRQGRVFALLLQGERFHSVALGDRVDQRFEVTALDASAIELFDPTSGARRRIGAPGP
jgi:hypothetical protein